MSEQVSQTDRRTVAHIAPLAAFMLFLTVPELLPTLGWDATDDTQPWYITSPRQWLYPLQTIGVLLLIVWYRREYELERVRGLGWALGVGVAGIALWILPGFLHGQLQLPDGIWKWLGCVERTDGFNPQFIAEHSVPLYWGAVLMRFLRMVVVVPLAEEIFWRAFLMRFVTDPEGDYWKVPFGQFNWRSYLVVTGLFMLVHTSVDYFPAFLFGTLMYWLAVRTKSLTACVLAHAVANLILGLYVMQTGQWGYW